VAVVNGAEMSLKEKDFDHFVKILLIGDSAVGKSCLLLRFYDNSYTPTFISTIGIDFKIRTIDLQGKRVKIQIIDTAGQERFKTITANYYRGAQGVMLVYDISNMKSFENIHYWMKNVKENAPESIVKLLIGNKHDLIASTPPESVCQVISLIYVPTET